MSCRVPRIYCPINLFLNTELGGTKSSGRRCGPRVSHGTLSFVPGLGVVGSHDKGREYFMGSRDAFQIQMCRAIGENRSNN